MPQRPLLAVVAIIAIGGAIFWLERGRAERIGGPAIELEPATADAIVREKAAEFEPAKEISTPDGFINTGELAIADIIGKQVVLVDFWTYSCINCQRTIPYLNRWHELYADQGLTIIGVHTPEFEFEKKFENVRLAVEKFGIKYPVVLDNDFSTWQAYRNQYWPRKYLIDIDGFIVYDHIGEGAYEETERKIQELLDERARRLGSTEDRGGAIEKPGGAVGVAFDRIRSPEVYFGSSRNDLLSTGETHRVGEQALLFPPEILPNRLYLSGRWNFTPEFAENREVSARIRMRYSAKIVNIVAEADGNARIRILRDGALLPVVFRGADLTAGAEEAAATINAAGLYELIRDTEYGEHMIEIIIESPGVRVFTFTFG